MIEPANILVSPVMTEKATEAGSLNQYAFKVVKEANRLQVKEAIERQFDVNVVKVNILNVKPKFKADRSRRGKAKRIPGYKKAIVHVKKGETLDIF